MLRFSKIDDEVYSVEGEGFIKYGDGEWYFIPIGDSGLSQVELESIVSVIRNLNQYNRITAEFQYNRIR